MARVELVPFPFYPKKLRTRTPSQVRAPSALTGFVPPRDEKTLANCFL
jgi:hypothetical protein